MRKFLLGFIVGAWVADSAIAYALGSNPKFRNRMQAVILEAQHSDEPLGVVEVRGIFNRA